MKGCERMSRGRCLVLRNFGEREAERSEEREWEMEVSSCGGDAVSAEGG